jgi:hypothetical protein
VDLSTVLGETFDVARDYSGACFSMAVRKEPRDAESYAVS